MQSYIPFQNTQFPNIHYQVFSIQLACAYFAQKEQTEREREGTSTVELPTPTAPEHIAQQWLTI